MGLEEKAVGYRNLTKELRMICRRKKGEQYEKRREVFEENFRNKEFRTFYHEVKRGRTRC